MKNRDVDGVRVMMTIQAFGARSTWTARHMASVLGWPIDRAVEVLWWLVQSDYLTTNQGEYHRTTEGDEWVAQAMAQAGMRESIAVWKDEALTGITKGGKRSRIDRAVLPTTKPPNEHRASPEDQVVRAQLDRQRHIKEAKRLGIDFALYTEWRGTGRLHICNGGGEPHQGVFDKKGDRWQSQCRQCTKQKRGRG